MKRHGGLWPQVLRFSNLLRAAEKAARGKKHLANVAGFHFDLERELFRLAQELRTRSYVPLPYRTFNIFEPKKRLISAAAFRDRVVHHALVNVLEPLFEATFIADSYACRKGKGTHAAVARFTHFARGNPYLLKCDVSKYFPSIDLEILRGLIARKVKDRDVLWLVDLIIDHSNPQEPVQEWYADDDLFVPTDRRRGLPLGNQTSQFFANVYLNPLDHFVLQELRPRGYLRYMDDFVLFDGATERLAEARERCRAFLATLRLRLHPRKAVIGRVADGWPFLGYRIFPDHRRLPKANLRRLQLRLERLRAAYRAGELSWRDVRRSLAGWLGHACWADTWRLRRALLEGKLFRRKG